MTPEELLKRIEELEFKLNGMVRPDRYSFERPIVGGADGLRIGNNANSRVAFYNITPAVQFQTSGQGTTFASNGAANMNGETSTHDGGLGGTAYTFGDVIRALKKIGIFKA